MLNVPSVNASVNNISPSLGTAYTTNITNGSSGTTTAQDNGSTAVRNYFNASAFIDKAGVLAIEMSTDNSTWREVKRVTLVANQGQVLTVPVTARYYRARVYNTDTSATTAVLVTTSLTMH